MNGDFTVASEDGRRLFVFSGSRHVRTISALTNATLLEFGYDSAGRLHTIIDGDGNTTTISHDMAGHPTAITGAFRTGHYAWCGHQWLSRNDWESTRR